MKRSILTTTILLAMPLFADDKQIGKGRQLFQEQCVGCHGPDGRAQTDMGKKVGAADLTSATIQQQSDSKLETVIKDGKEKMPAFNSKLSDDEIRSVLQYVRQMGQKE